MLSKTPTNGLGEFSSSTCEERMSTTTDTDRDRQSFAETAMRLSGKSEDPSGWFVRSYPRFKTKRVLRFLFDHFQSDTLFNLLLSTKPMRMAAGVVYFHHKGVFDPTFRKISSRAEEQVARDTMPR